MIVARPREAVSNPREQRFDAVWLHTQDNIIRLVSGVVRAVDGAVVALSEASSPGDRQEARIIKYTKTVSYRSEERKLRVIAGELPWGSPLQKRATSAATDRADEATVSGEHEAHQESSP